MSMSPLADRIAAEHAGAFPGLLTGPVPRRAAIEALGARGLPVTRDENWKYANLRPLERLKFTPALLAPPAGAPRVLVKPTELPPALPGFGRWVFVDGGLVPALSDASGPAAAWVASIASLADDAAAGASRPQRTADERFALLNDAFATDGAAIRVPSVPGEPARIELVFVASADADSGASYPRIELHLEPQARLVLVERHVSAGAGASFVNSAVAVELGRGAALHHYRLQELAPRATVLDTLSAVAEADAVYRLHAVIAGAQSARSTLRVRLAGERADLALSVAALGDRQQVLDSYALVEHAAPRARTEQTFRGIAAGRARVAFNGKIVVERDAAGTDSRQSLRGLLAGPEAEIDVRPQLEIYTDEVRCSHGATAGKLDENMLFYLLARGLERAAAERALKWAFLEDVVARVEIPELRRYIERRLAGQMQDGAALEELI